MTQAIMKSILEKVHNSSTGDWVVQEGMKHYNEKFQDKTTVLRAVGNGTRFKPMGNIVAFIESINPTDKHLLSSFKAELKQVCEYGILLSKLLTQRDKEIADLNKDLASTKKQLSIASENLRKKNKRCRELEYLNNNIKRRLNNETRTRRTSDGLGGSGQAQTPNEANAY